MLFNKQYIRQVIMEEITDYVRMKNKVQSGKNKNLDNMQRDLIRFFSYYRDILTDKTSIGIDDSKKTQQNFKKGLVAIKVQYKVEGSYSEFIKYCIETLSDVADPQLVNFIRNIVIKTDNTQSYADKLNNYGMSISPAEEKHSNQIRDPDDGFMRVRKSDNVVDDQEDLRRSKKF